MQRPASQAYSFGGKFGSPGAANYHHRIAIATVGLPMLTSEVIKISIDRPYADVYEFVANPANFTKWAANPDSRMEAIGGDWLVDLPSGRRVIRFTRRNEFGVLDYQVFDPGQAGGPVTPVRLIANGEGCELVLLWFQRQGISDNRFKSDVEWVASDLQRLKALLEQSRPDEF